jgi:hypothetical protein
MLDNIYVVTVATLILFFSTITIVIALLGVKDLVVGRKVIDYTFDSQKKFLHDVMDETDMDDLDMHAADNPDMQFYPNSN